MAAWIAAQGADLAVPLAPVLVGLHADAALIGAASAVAAASGSLLDLGGWKPGNPADAGRRLAGLVDQPVKVPDYSGSIAETRLHGLARVLIDADPQATTASVAAALRANLADEDETTRLALAEAVRAGGIAALAAYWQLSVHLGRWLIDPFSNVCAVCLDNAEAGPVPIGSPYPSGDLTTPAHGGCRCAVVPA